MDNNEPGTAYRLSGGGLLSSIHTRIRGPNASVTPLARFLVTMGLLWLPLAVVTAITGTFAGDKVAQPFITDVVPQVRFLIALPLLLFAGMAIDPAIDYTIRNLINSGVVPEKEQSQFQAALMSLARRRDSIWPDIIILISAFIFTLAYHPGYGQDALELADTTWIHPDHSGTDGLSIAGWWYFLICAPLFQLILLRWIWRFLIWTGFLFQLSRIRFTLHSTHPDLAGGIGTLGLSQQAFVVLFIALGTVLSSTIAYDMMFGSGSVEGAKLDVIAFIVICLVALYAPLMLFANQMYVARRRGLRQYGALGYRMSAAFWEQWIARAGKDVGTKLKEAVDPSAMADYGTIFDTVRNMRFVPVSPRNIATTAAALTAPFLPLYLISFSITDLIDRIVNALV